MLATSLYPLRSSLGPAIPIATTKEVPDIRVFYQSPDLQSLNVTYEFRSYASLADAQQSIDLASFLPTLMRGQTAVTPADGAGRLPPLPESPLPADSPLVSLVALAKSDRRPQSRALTALLQIRLAKKSLVGGICFGGYAYLPTRYLESGLSTSNFGLPRDWRLTPLGSSSDSAAQTGNGAFLDSETNVTKQELLSHSGSHFLLCEPTFTDTIELGLSDWPQIIRQIQLSGMEEMGGAPKFGFVVPYFYVFEYRECTRYHANVPVGMLATRPTPGPGTLSEPEFSYVRGSRYFPFCATSLSNGGRTYQTAAHTRQPNAINECFISQPVSPGQGIVLYWQQAQEHARCLSGFQMLSLFIPPPVKPARGRKPMRPTPGAELDFSALSSLTADQLAAKFEALFHLPPGIKFAEALRIRVWEVDPPEGLAPTQVAIGQKYTSLLADLALNSLTELLPLYSTGVRFNRVTSARYLAVELLNTGRNDARFVVSQLQFIQSAHVSVTTRPSRSQRVRALNFRLVGDSLGEDLSQIGKDGFGFAVEHWAAGERKAVLFRANSLFDLVHTGVGRLQTNMRRRASELETSEYGAETDQLLNDFRANFDDRRSEGFSNSWRRTESGGGVAWPGDASVGPAAHKNGNGESDFASVSNQQTRTHVSYLYPDGSAAQWNSAAIFANALGLAFEAPSILAGNDLIQTYKADASHPQELVRNFQRPWRNVSASDLKITGTTSVVQSPYSLTAILGTEIQNTIEALSGAITIAVDAMKGQPISPAAVAQVLGEAGDAGVFAALLSVALNPLIPGSSIATNLITAAFALNGFTANLSVSPGGIGASFGSAPGNLLPVVTQSAMLGNQGTVSRSASQSEYSYNQSLIAGGDDGTNTTYHRNGLMKRTVTRAENQQNNSRVRGGEVMWQGQITDVVSGVIPLNVVLPALAAKESFRNADESIRVRLAANVGPSISVDFWFDVAEEMVRDDN